MSRNIVLLSDGTGNSSGKLFRTNVWRTYQALDLRDPAAPPQPRQYAFYDDGVGTSSFKPLAVLGGAVGVGLARNVRHLYAALCRTYRPADPATDREADRIFAFGFSRGAFTIRVLTGLVMTQGLVEYDGDEAKLERNVASAWRAYRAERYGSKLGLVELFRGLRDGALALRAAVLPGYTPYAEVSRIGKPLPAGTNVDAAALPPRDRPIEIAFLGLWDTVEAYGLPVDELTRAVDKVFWPLSMPTHDLSPRVRRAMHALSLDDERNTFHPKLWNERPEDVVLADDQAEAGAGARPLPVARISQVWFAGVHSNLGGGYPDDSLSHVSLNWILDGAAAAGLRFEDPIRADYAALADENGPIYDPRRGLGSFYRYNPRRIATVLAKDRITVQSITIHESALRRIKAGLDGYAPIVLPPAFEVLTIAGRIMDGAEHLGQRGLPIVPAETEHVWNVVWWRRAAYFFTLFAALALAVFPALVHPPEAGACRSSFCVLSAPIGWLSAVLPSFASPWLDSFAANPGWFLLVALLVAAGMVAGTVLQIAASDRMRLAWYNETALCPTGVAPGPCRPPGFVDRRLERFRTTAGYHRSADWTTRLILPGAFVILVAIGSLALASRLVVAVADASGLLCSSGADASDTIRTAALCNATPQGVQAGAVYRLRLTISEAWLDGATLPFVHGLPATPNGILRGYEPWYLRAAVPIRRHLAEPWFALMVRVGGTGSDTYAPVWRRTDRAVATTATAAPGEIWEAIVTPRSSGRLYVYVNDATLFAAAVPFYAGNRGGARLDVMPEVGAR